MDDKQIVYINSHDRLTGSDNDFTYAINLDPNKKFDQVTCLLASIPKSFYTTSQAGINYFTLIEGAQTALITVPTGNYSRNALAVTLSSLLTSGSPNHYTYVVSFPNSATSVDTGYYTYTVSGNGATQPAFRFDTITFMNEPMGFIQSTTQTLTYNFSGNVLVSDVVCNLQIFQCVQIHSNIVNNKFMTAKNTDILQTVLANIGSPPFGCIGWVCYDYESFSADLSDGNTGSARFYLTDEDSVPISLNGVNMQIVLMFWKKNKSPQLLTGFIKYLTAIGMKIMPKIFQLLGFEDSPELS